MAKKGFASMIRTEAGRQRQKEIAKQGGTTSRDKGALYQFTPEQRFDGGSKKKPRRRSPTT